MSKLPSRDSALRSTAKAGPHERVRPVFFGLAFIAWTAGLFLLARQHTEIDTLRARIPAVPGRPGSSETKAALAERAQSLAATLARVAQERSQVGEPMPREKTFEERAAEPAFRKLYLRARETELDRRYGILFARLNLSAERAELLRDLLTRRDVDPPLVRTSSNEDERIEARRQQRELCEKDIVEFLTPEERAHYAALKAEMPASNLVSELQNLLASSTETLDRAQTAKLMQLVTSPSSVRVEEANWPEMDRATYLITGEVFEAARNFLSPTQLRTLADLQELQLAQIALNHRIAQVYESR